MMTSNARKIENNERRIIMTVRREKKNLAAQKLAGIVMLFFVGISVLIGGYFMSALVIAPLALAAVFSKEKVLDFGIFAVPQNDSKLRNF